MLYKNIVISFSHGFRVEQSWYIFNIFFDEITMVKYLSIYLSILFDGLARNTG